MITCTSNQASFLRNGREGNTEEEEEEGEEYAIGTGAPPRCDCQHLEEGWIGLTNCGMGLGQTEGANEFRLPKAASNS